MLWDRELIELVFDYNHKWEVYTLVKKREYGYYVLPILYKSSFIGRIEFEKHRQNKALLLKGLWLEKDNHEIQEYLKDALFSFSK
jgi:uncharacterized protein YcaQ